MSHLLFIILVIVAIWALAYYRAKFLIWTGVLAAVLLFHSYFSAAGKIALSIEWLIFLIITAPLNILPIRRRLSSARILAIYKRIMPKMSRTEEKSKPPKSVNKSLSKYVIEY